MTIEEIIVITVRLSGAIPVLFFPFFGSIFAILIDLSYLFIMYIIHISETKRQESI